MSVVPSPDRALDEAWRVLKAGRDPDRHELLRRLGRTSRRLERRMETAAAWLGWHPNFPYSDVGNWIDVAPRRAHRRAQRASADETVHAARIEKAGSAEQARRRRRAWLVSSAIELTFCVGRAFAAP